MIKDFHIKYRPKTFKDVVGQEGVVKSLTSLFKTDDVPHAFLFYGPSGCGKTTLARIVAHSLGCKEANITEIDAASNNGVDNIRALTGPLQYSSLNDVPVKMVILDEVHMLSMGAFNALLKTLEEPPNHVYIALCTTEYQKIPETIKKRCHRYQLKEIDYKDLYELTKRVALSEKLRVSDDALKMIARSAAGCPRDALIFLSQCRMCESKSDVAGILESHIQNREVKDLCRIVSGVTRPNFKEVQTILIALQEKNPESVRILVSNYLSKCVLGADNRDKMIFFYKRLNEFSKPITNNQAFSEIVLNTLSAIYD